MKRFFVLAAVVGLLAGFGAQALADHCTADNGQLAFCQWGTGCYTVNNDYAPNIGAECSALISNCMSAGTLYTGASVPPALSAPPYGEGAQCSAVGGLTLAEGSVVVDQCKTSGGEQLYCQWNTGCYEINNSGTNAGKTCTELESSCEADGQLFTGVTGLNAENNYGEGVQCGEAGGSPVGGGPVVEQCRTSGGAQLYCQWETGCYAINNGGTNAGKSCSELVSACNTDGQLFTGVTGLNAENNYGEGVQCAEAGGTTTSVRYVAASAKSTPNLRVSYAKNRVTVNWTPSTKVSSGTVSLINAKGVTLSTAFIKASNGKVSVKLGTVGVPTGMYFIQINAIGQDGKKLVSQSAVSIVK